MGPLGVCGVKASSAYVRFNEAIEAGMTLELKLVHAPDRIAVRACRCDGAWSATIIVVEPNEPNDVEK